MFKTTRRHNRESTIASCDSFETCRPAKKELRRDVLNSIVSPPHLGTCAVTDEAEDILIHPHENNFSLQCVHIEAEGVADEQGSVTSRFCHTVHDGVHKATTCFEVSPPDINNSNEHMGCDDHVHGPTILLPVGGVGLSSSSSITAISMATTTATTSSSCCCAMSTGHRSHFDHALLLPDDAKLSTQETHMLTGSPTGSVPLTASTCSSVYNSLPSSAATQRESVPPEALDGGGDAKELAVRVSTESPIGAEAVVSNSSHSIHSNSNNMSSNNNNSRNSNDNRSALQGTSNTLSRCRARMRCMNIPAFDLDLVEKSQDSATMLDGICNAAQCNPLSKITRYLYIGTWRDACDVELLRRHHITVVLNVAAEVECGQNAGVAASASSGATQLVPAWCSPSSQENSTPQELNSSRPSPASSQKPTQSLHSPEIHYTSIPMKDCHNEKLITHFEQAFRIIDEARRQNTCALVHCRRGISRSAAIVIAYLMATGNRSYECAFQHVLQRRHCISLNLAFHEALSEYKPDPSLLHVHAHNYQNRMKRSASSHPTRPGHLQRRHHSHNCDTNYRSDRCAPIRSTCVEHSELWGSAAGVNAHTAHHERMLHKQGRMQFMRLNEDRTQSHSQKGKDSSSSSRHPDPRPHCSSSSSSSSHPSLLPCLDHCSSHRSSNHARNQETTDYSAEQQSKKMQQEDAKGLEEAQEELADGLDSRVEEGNGRSSQDTRTRRGNVLCGCECVVSSFHEDFPSHSSLSQPYSRCHSSSDPRHRSERFLLSDASDDSLSFSSISSSLSRQADREEEEHEQHSDCMVTEAIVVTVRSSSSSTYSATVTAAGGACGCDARSSAAVVHPVATTP